MRPWLIVLAAVGVAAILDGSGAGRLRGEDPSPSRPPWQRLLQGADADKAEELQKHLDAQLAAGKLDDAVRSAEESARLRQARQGKDHWQAVDARLTVEALRLALRSTPADREEFLKSFQLAGRAAALEYGREAEEDS
jgi:hypothetical protein